MPTETKLPGKITKGRTWNDAYANHSHTHFHSWDYPTDWGDLLGFRCVYPIDKEHITERSVLRGGSWYYDFTVLFHAHYRYRGNPVYRSYNPGFRCVYPVKSND